MTENKQYILIPFEEGNLIFKDDGREFFNSVDCLKDNEIVDLLNEQYETIQEYKHLVKIATSLIEWNTIPQVRREWEKHLSKVGDVE